ncbi:MAG: hypothetical protein AAGL18_08150 [Pseudomonadota bacterium]
MPMGVLEIDEKMELSFPAMPASTQPVDPVAPLSAKSDTIDVDAFRATSTSEKIDVDFGNLRSTSPVSLEIDAAAIEAFGRVYFVDPAQVDLGLTDALSLF